MGQYINKSAVVAEIERRRKEWWYGLSTEAKFKKEECDDILSFLDTLEVKEVQEEPVSEDLEEAANNYVGHAPEIDEDLSCFTKRNAFIAGAKWKKGSLWKNAQGNNLPEIDREVIVLVKSLPEHEDSLLKVSFAHRPPERWYGRNLDGEEHVFEPKTYDKGEWNIPNVVWWLDLDLPIKGE